MKRITASTGFNKNLLLIHMSYYDVSIRPWFHYTLGGTTGLSAVNYKVLEF